MKKVKFALPMLAVMFAVVGALATGFSTLPLTVKPVVVNTSTCDQTGTCNDQNSSANCTTSGGSNLFERVSATSCSVQAKGVYTPQ